MKRNRAIAPVAAAVALGLLAAACGGTSSPTTEAATVTTVPATLGRQFDLALGTATDLIRAGAAGVDVVQAAGNTNSTKENPFVKLIVKADSGITAVSQLKGARRSGPPP